MDTEREELFRRAEASLKEYYELREAGAAPSFEEWCEGNKAVATELKELHDACESLESLAMHGVEAVAPPPMFDAPALLRRLREGSNRYFDYELDGEVARGGMGRILAGWDEVLQRDFAMKVLLTSDLPSGPDGTRLSRFLDEAQMTGRLEHPGIVPVYELGVDPEGMPYFTMKRVRGRTLREVFDEIARGTGRWSTVQAVGFLLRVCETMAYAHERGVVHRDLKPTNVMVGDFGEVYVMDWGLARVVAAPERTHGTATPAALEDPSPGTAPRTLEGTTLGTPAYMAPEQAEGATAAVGPASDVYTVGAMVYHLLAGRPPYGDGATPRSPDRLLDLVRAGPPRSIGACAPRAPIELTAICERAMAREPADRYSSMRELAMDLRAFQEGRVVAAYETGPLAELRKWVRRHPGESVLAGLVVVLLLSAAVGFMALQERWGNRDRLRNDVYLAESLVREERALWPAVPERIPDFDDWLSRAGDLESRAEAHARRSGTLDDPMAEDRAERLHASMETLFARDAGSVARVEGRREFARNLAHVSTTSRAARDAWAEAQASIADAKESPEYAGLEIRPQVGLIPLGRDPRSNLWEFAHLPSGAVSRRDPIRGTLDYASESGIVLVLVPGGTFAFGTQDSDPSGPNYDPYSQPDEQPPRRVTLPPFFISKYEVTQAQWMRIEGANPSLHVPGSRWAGREPTLLNPVEGITWDEGRAFARKIGLDLPTEEQWEYAARAGTTTPWSTGFEIESLQGYANLHDAYSLEHGGPPAMQAAPWSDGHQAPAPVGSYLPNPFGLHDVHGNVWEICLSSDPALGDDLGPASEKVAATRGGGALNEPIYLRSGNRSRDFIHARSGRKGLRPVRGLR